MRLFWAKTRLSAYALEAWREPDAVAPQRGSLLRKCFLFLFVLLLCSSLVGKAQAPAPVTPAAAAAAVGGASFTGVSAVEMIAQAVETNLRALKENSNLKALGTYLLGFFILANLVWIFVKGYFAGGGFFSAVLGDLVPLAIMAGVASLFLSSDVGTLILKSLDTVAAAIGGLGGTPSMSVADLIRESMITTFSTLSNLWAVGGISSVNVASFLDLTGSVMMVLASFLAKLVAMAATTFLIALALCIFLATLITSQVVAIIAIVLAPMFVPFLLFKPASFMFDGWLRFTLGAGMMKIIGLIMLQVTNVIMATLGAISTNARQATPSGSLDQFGVDMVLYCSMILLAGLAAYLMAQVPSIATGLISGNGGGAGFGGWANIASKSMATRGITGGMMDTRSGKAAGAGGAIGNGNANALGSLTRAMPYAMKPVTNAIGAGVSKGMGGLRAGADMRAAKAASGGERNIRRDTSRMSAGTAAAYTSYLEKANASTQQRESGGGFVGPPTPPYTLSKPASSLTSRTQAKK